MKLASIKVDAPLNREEAIQGRLIVASDNLLHGARIPASMHSPHQAATLLWALENWQDLNSELAALSEQLNTAQCSDPIDLSTVTFKAPITQAPEFLDGSAFIAHVERVRRARGAEPPETLKTDPLMYQGTANFTAHQDDIRIQDQSHGVDLESEIAVITDFVPEGCSPGQAAKRIRLLALLNDVSLRGLIPAELAKQFGFLQGKPASAFAPFVVSVEQLEREGLWKDGRLHVQVRSSINGQEIGHPNAGTMHFSFPELVAHAARTRDLLPGTIIGSGTVSEPDESTGVSCLAEKRVLEQINSGEARTPFLKEGDLVEIEVLVNGQSLFGQIRQRVTAYKPPR